MPVVGSRCHELRVRDQNKNWRIIYAIEKDAIQIRVINNGKMLRNFVKIVRSGVAGRKSLGTAPK